MITSLYQECYLRSLVGFSVRESGRLKIAQRFSAG
jgi:hypothetical protein